MTDPVRRVHYFPGQLLTPDDLQAEQDYHRRMRYLANRLHGWGVVGGFEVTADDTAVVVGPGLAIDPLGREIVLTEECRLPWAAEAGDVFVCVIWAEEPDAFTVGSHPDEPPFSRWLERPRVTLEPDLLSTESILLARVSPTTGGPATVDCSARPVLRVPPSSTAS